jgi:hypothetical protein
MRSDAPLPARDSRASALLHSAAVLAGWLWLGYQGQRLGWSLAGGLGVVALWWALRLLLAGWRARGDRIGAWRMGLATGMGVLLVEQDGLGGLGGAGLQVLLATAVAWALWCAALERCGAGGNTHRPGPGRCHTTALAARVLPATAMGLMMGSLWQTGQWCAATGWSPSVVVLLHIGCMLLPALLRGPAHRLQTQALGRDALPLALLVLGGACVWATATPAGGTLGMGLQATAWALCSRPLDRATDAAHPLTASPAASGARLALLGPLLLLLVGLLSPTAGPAALHGAQALVAAVALAALFALFPALWRLARRTPLSPGAPAAPTTLTDAP